MFMMKWGMGGPEGLVDPSQANLYLTRYKSPQFSYLPFELTPMSVAGPSIIS